MLNIINSDLFFFLLALIVSALLGFLIGWLIKSIKINVLKESLDTCIKNNEDLKNQIKSDSNNKNFNTQIPVLKKIPELDKKVDLSDSKELKVASTYKPTSPNKSSSQFIKEDVKKTLGKSIKENDLKVVEGIGPKIEEILNKDGIKTWRQLSKAPVSRLQKILNEAGERFLFHKPDTWPKQSLLAAEGKWEELKKLQDYLDGGKEPS
jgi:predicted flap endonuclease-1-like 5' DNA nuclease